MFSKEQNGDMYVWERMYFSKMMYQIIFVNCKDIIERENEEMISCRVSADKNFKYVSYISTN